VQKANFFNKAADFSLKNFAPWLLGVFALKRTAFCNGINLKEEPL